MSTMKSLRCRVFNEAYLQRASYRFCAWMLSEYIIAFMFPHFDAIRPSLDVFAVSRHADALAVQGELIGVCMKDTSRLQMYRSA